MGIDRATSLCFPVVALCKGQEERSPPYAQPGLLAE